MPADKSWPEARQERPQLPVSEPAPGDSHQLTEHLPNLRNYHRQPRAQPPGCR